jgi:hypothetical protein
VEPGVVPPGFCGARRLVLQGAWAVKGGFLSRVRLETALGSTEETPVPAFAGMGFLVRSCRQSECPGKNRKYDRPISYGPKKRLQ